jgi:hypothetical protein
MIHPRRAVANLVRSRDTICAARIFSGKTATHRRKINFRPNSRFIHSTEFFEPAKKRLAGGVRKWSLQNRLARSGRLTNDHYVTHDCASRDWRGFHARAATAFEQGSHMSIESSLNYFCSHGPVGRSHMA